MINKDVKVFLTTSMKWLCGPHVALHSKVLHFLKCNNYLIVSDINEADYVILNTCWFDDNSEMTSIKAIMKVNNKHKYKKLIVIWCLPDISKETKWRENNIVISDRNIWMLDDVFKHDISINDIDDYDIVKPISIWWEFKYDDNLSPLWDKDTLFIEISKWCNQSCSYCAIKRVKWNTKSKSLDLILREIDRWIKMWFKKVFFISDDCWSYGEDIWSNISELVNSVLDKYGDLWILFNYLEPSNFLKYFNKIKLDYIKNNILYINIPLQTTSQRLLKLMNRHYNIGEVIEKVKKFRRETNIVFVTQMIYWFPSETLDEFYDSLKVINVFHYVSFFCYSKKPNTVAATYSNQLWYNDLYIRYKIMNKLLTKYWKNRIWHNFDAFKELFLYKKMNNDNNVSM